MQDETRGDGGRRYDEEAPSPPRRDVQQQRQDPPGDQGFVLDGSSTLLPRGEFSNPPRPFWSEEQEARANAAAAGAVVDPQRTGDNNTDATHDGEDEYDDIEATLLQEIDPASRSEQQQQQEARWNAAAFGTMDQSRRPATPQPSSSSSSQAPAAQMMNAAASSTETENCYYQIVDMDAAHDDYDYDSDASGVEACYDVEAAAPAAAAPSVQEGNGGSNSNNSSCGGGDNNNSSSSSSNDDDDDDDDYDDDDDTSGSDSHDDDEEEEEAAPVSAYAVAASRGGGSGSNSNSSQDDDEDDDDDGGGDGKPDPFLPQFKDQVRQANLDDAAVAAAAAAAATAMADDEEEDAVLPSEQQATTMTLLPEFKDQARPATNIKVGHGDGGGSGGGGDDDDSSNKTNQEQDKLPEPNFKDQVQRAGFDMEQEDSAASSIYAVAAAAEDPEVPAALPTNFPPQLDGKNPEGMYDGPMDAVLDPPSSLSTINNANRSNLNGLAGTGNSTSPESLAEPKLAGTNARLSWWLAMSMFGAFTLAAFPFVLDSSIEDHGYSTIEFTVGFTVGLGLSFSGLLLSLMAHRFFVGKIPEVVFVVIFLVAWSYVLIVISDPDNYIAVARPPHDDFGPSIIYGGLYISAWLTMFSCSFLSAGLVQDFIVNDSIVCVKRMTTTVVHGHGLTMSSLIVLGSALPVYFECNSSEDYNMRRCQHTRKIAVIMGAIGAILAAAPVFLALKAHKKMLPLRAESALAVLHLALWGCGVGFFTLGEHAATGTLCTLLPGIWVSFVQATFWCGECLQELQYNRLQIHIEAELYS